MKKRKRIRMRNTEKERLVHTFCSVLCGSLLLRRLWQRPFSANTSKRGFWADHLTILKIAIHHHVITIPRSLFSLYFLFYLSFVGKVGWTNALRFLLGSLQSVEHEHANSHRTYTARHGGNGRAEGSYMFKIDITRKTESLRTGGIGHTRSANIYHHGSWLHHVSGDKSRLTNGCYDNVSSLTLFLSVRLWLWHTVTVASP